MELTSALREAYDHVKDSLATSQTTQKKHYDKKRREVSFKVGELVKLKAHPRSDASAGFSAKLAPVYKGPYRIAEVKSDLDYKLTRVADGAEGGVHHVCNLLPFFTWDREGEDQEGRPHKSGETKEPGNQVEDNREEEYGFDLIFGEAESRDQHLDSTQQKTLTNGPAAGPSMKSPLPHVGTQVTCPQPVFRQ
ncbi:Transposon Ty3-I Gag-Pol poly, partial [Clarias magur]